MKQVLVRKKSDKLHLFTFEHVFGQSFKPNTPSMSIPNILQQYIMM